MSQKRSYAAYQESSPYTLYGTPLPPLDASTRDDGSYVPPWKQEVTDDRGRKRLHGAFTGGWSAGYFNTVGSKEGWAPKTFVSSRKDRVNKDGEAAQSKRQYQQQSAEDFMDEEDLAERDERRGLEMQGGFAGLGGAEGSGGERGMFSDLFKSSGETMGTKLLQRMGWRQGQGVGPKIKRRAKGDEKGEVHLFAPENSRMIGFEKKTDRKGIGYAGEGRLVRDDGQGAQADQEGEDVEQDARILRPGRSAKPGKLKKKAGFGVGVLNDTGSDDEDPYSVGPQIDYSRIIGGDRKKKKGGLTATNANPGVKNPIAPSRALAQQSSRIAGFRKCHDGRLPLDGFVLALTPLTLLQENKYPPPTPPSEWSPSKKSTNDTTQPSEPYQSTSDAAKASTLDPKSRAALLAEPQLPGKSVFDFLSPAARDKIAAVSGKSDLPLARGEGAPSGFDNSSAEKRRTLWDLVPSLDKEVAAAALQRRTSGWTPYADDEDKRERYRYFLELKAGKQSDLPARSKNGSVDDWAKEMREFAQAAMVFKPISGLMASRFTTSSSSSVVGAGGGGNDAATREAEEDPAEKAARMGMFGPSTRSRQVFHPPRLMCKRFGVPVPVSVDPGGAPDGTDGGGGAAAMGEAGRLELVSQSSLDRMMQDAVWTKPGGLAASRVTESAAGGMAAEEGEEQGRIEQQTWGRDVIDLERNDALETEKASEAVFKSVFGDD